MYRHIRGRILFCIKSKFPLKGESVKGGSTVHTTHTEMKDQHNRFCKNNK